MGEIYVAKFDFEMSKEYVEDSRNDCFCNIRSERLFLRAYKFHQFVLYLQIVKC